MSFVFSSHGDVSRPTSTLRRARAIQYTEGEVPIQRVERATPHSMAHEEEKRIIIYSDDNYLMIIKGNYPNNMHTYFLRPVCCASSVRSLFRWRDSQALDMMILGVEMRSAYRR